MASATLRVLYSNQVSAPAFHAPPLGRQDIAATREDIVVRPNSGPRVAMVTGDGGTTTGEPREGCFVWVDKAGVLD